jgi:hypothetical protein
LHLHEVVIVSRHQVAGYDVGAIPDLFLEGGERVLLLAIQSYMNEHSHQEAEPRRIDFR